MADLTKTGSNSRATILRLIDEWDFVLSAYFYHFVINGSPPREETSDMFVRFQRLTTFLCHIADARKVRLDPTPIGDFYTLVCKSLSGTSQTSVGEIDAASLAATLVVQR